MMDFPPSIEANAWTGTAGLSGPGIDPEEVWGIRGRAFQPRPSIKTLLPTAVDERDWSDSRVGWGLVAVDKEGWSDTDNATGKDLPDPVQKLVAARNNGPILRYRSEALNGYLRRYYADGLSACDLDVAAQRTGTGDYQVPKYLLIYGGPVEIPWRAQYALNVSRCVGRIDLEGDALERYVNHLVGDWAGVECNPLAPVIWSVNFGGADITSLMQQVLADVLAKRFAGDADFGGAVHLHDKDATGAALVHRFQNLNHIRRPDRVYRTKCGRQDGN